MDCAEGLETAPLFAPRDYEAPSLFTPENLLREARRQKGLATGTWSISSMPQVAQAAIPLGRATTRCSIPSCRRRSSMASLGA